MANLNTPRDLVSAYRAAPAAEPPAALDQAIRTAARQALQPAPQPWWQGHGVALRAALGFSFVAIFSLTLLLPNLPKAPEPPAQQRVERPATSAAPAAEGSSTAKETVAGANFPAAPATDKKAEAEAKPQTRPAEPPILAKVPANAPSTAATNVSGYAIPPSSVTPAGMAAPAARAAEFTGPSTRMADSAERADERVAAKMSAAPANAGALNQPAQRNDQAIAGASAQRSLPSPQTQLDEIATLFDKGQTDEAKRRLREFRKAHPDIPIPEALQKQAEK